MAPPVCAIVTTVIGAGFVLVASIVGYVAVPNIIRNSIISEVELRNDTIQMERFQNIPFPLDMKIHLFNVTNSDDVMNGLVPIIEETGPFVYKIHRQRVIEEIDNYTVSYQILEHYEFDEEASYPYHELDTVTIVNSPFHAILQRAEETESPFTMALLNLVLPSVFGQYSTPYVTYRVKDILFEGIHLCVNPSSAGNIVCDTIRETAQTTPNLQILENNTVLFSFFGHKNGFPGQTFKVHRGMDDVKQLGNIITWNNSPQLNFWTNPSSVGGQEHGTSVCNMLNGTDTGIYPPFVDTDLPLFGYNPDICRSVELRYERDENYEGIPAVRYSALEWFLDNEDGCFCVNSTQGITQPNGCLHRGAMELYSCVGAYMVLTYPHFLFADFAYLNGVIGLRPNVENHRIFLDLEPNSGVIIRGAKRAQFNIFARPITGIVSTQSLRTTLTPIFWVEEGMALPEEFVDEVKTQLLRPIRIVDILVPLLVAIGALILVIGVALLIKNSMSKKPEGIVGLGTNAQPFSKN